MNTTELKSLSITSAWLSFNRLCSGVAPGTAGCFHSNLNVFSRFCHLSPDEALYEFLKNGPEQARSQVMKWAESMGRQIASDTIAHRVGSLKRFVSQAAADGIVDWRLNAHSIRWRKRRSLDGADVATRHITQMHLERKAYEDIVAKLDAIALRIPSTKRQEEERLMAIRDLAMISLSENPGLWPFELRAVNARNYQRGPRATITTFGFRRSKPDVLPIARRVAGFVERWLRIRFGGPDDPLFTRFVRPVTGKNEGKLMLTRVRLAKISITGICMKRSREMFYGSEGLDTSAWSLTPRSLRDIGVNKLGELHGRGRISLGEAMAVARLKKPDRILFYGRVVLKPSRFAVNAMDRLR